MKKILLPLLAVCLVFSLAACRIGKEPMRVSNTVAPVSGKTLSADAMRGAILSACAATNWRASESGPGQITATLIVRNKHTVVVDIPYSEKGYSILYKSSTNMEYKKNSDGSSKIHPNYNNWVIKLDRAINEKVVAAQR